MPYAAVLQIDVVVPEQRLQQLERLVCEVVRDAEAQGLAVMVWGLAVIRYACFSKSLQTPCACFTYVKPHIHTLLRTGVLASLTFPNVCLLAQKL